MKSIDKLREAATYNPAFSDNATRIVCNYLSCIEAEIADNYMRLPVDADGVPIHVGDVMMDGKTPRYAVAVAPESFMMDGYETGSFYRPGLAKNHRHVKPRTLEDVLMDAGVSRAAINDVADEIRELLGGDE